ncbi:hypothetical protein BDP55DRAFT_635701 [Colletotrichum godetiae]|uniref:Uncharacterized protein n=1 Tax=Colletotrichum godetiae TaxID=1209918 RepID=A0AAJ0ETU1_9PEZI|nr:uncharacterized protein BDP55DRAFT_635701 [Colletotrichum godetiae]KAK1671635.1 hypothetical protein BDP55DRAFT_635701 [Colletotrichum godetiae]
MKTIPYATLLMALAYFANALPQTPGEGCDSVAICNDVCGKQGMVSSIYQAFLAFLLFVGVNPDYEAYRNVADPRVKGTTRPIASVFLSDHDTMIDMHLPIARNLDPEYSTLLLFKFCIKIVQR